MSRSVDTRVDVVLVVDVETAREAESLVAGCEGCTDDAKLPFDYLLDALTGLDLVNSEYLLSKALSCPRCGARITEKTLIRVV